MQAILGPRGRWPRLAIVHTLAAITAALLVTSALAQSPKPDDELADVLAVSRAFKRVVRIAAPGVVSIRVEGSDGEKVTDEEKESRRQKLREMFEGKIAPDLLEQLLKRIDNDQRPDFMPPGLGSGVILDTDGHIVTNNHVVGGRGQITVVLADDRELPAKIVGTDSKTDLAVIKIDAPNLTALKFANSDEVEVGDWAIAVGAPFGLSKTVTHGIISAKGRKDIAGLAIKYQDFLQTDAAVNPGNSGGPLLNLNGEVIGINTAIASYGEAYNAGIAFTIPSNMVLRIAKQLREGGAVKRGWLGISYDGVSKDDRAVFSLPETGGVIVQRVLVDSPAERAKLQPEDVIVEINGSAVRDRDQFRDLIADLGPEIDVKIDVVRDGKRLALSTTLSLQPPDERIPRSAALYREVPPLGILVRTLRAGQPTGFESSQRGVLLVAVQPGSPVNVDTGLLLISVNDKPVVNAGQLIRAVGDASKTDKVKLEFLDTTGDRTIKWVTPK